VCPQGGRNGTLGDSSAPCQGGDGVEIDNVTEMRATPRWLGPAAVAVGIGLALWAWWLDRPPAPLSVDAPAERFSAARARIQLEHIAARPHMPGSAEHAQVRDYLVGELRVLGYETEVQETTVLDRRGRVVRAVTVRNILARKRGTASTGGVAIASHYDSQQLPPGAGDDGAGVAATLEALRALAVGEPLRNDLYVLITDAEELGLIGARGFVDEHPWWPEITVLLNFEARGGAGQSVMFETNNDNGWVVREFARADPYPTGSSLYYEIYQRLPNDTDFSIFKRAGVTGLNFAFIERADVYHRPTDGIENLSMATLQHHGEHALAMTRHFGELDLDVATTAPDVVFFRIVGFGMVSYPYAWVGVLTLLALLFAAGVGIAGFRRRRLRIAGLAAGLVMSAAAVATAAALAWLLWQSVSGAHHELGSIVGRALYNEAWHGLAVACIAVGSVAALFGLARLRFDAASLAAGAVIMPLALAVASWWFAPGLSMLFLWPAVFTVGAVRHLLAGSGERVLDGGDLVVLGVLGAPVVLLLFPLVWTVYISLNITVAPIIAALAVLLLILLLPLFELAGQGNRRWLPATAFGLAVAFALVGVVDARPGSGRPIPSDLLYALDRETGAAVWATMQGGDDGWIERFVGDEAEAGDLAGFLAGSTRAYRRSVAPRLDSPRAAVSVVADVTDGRVRTVRLEITSAIGPELMTVSPLEGTDLRLVAMNGVQVPGRAPTDSQSGDWLLRHFGEPPGGTLTLELQTERLDAPLEVVLVEFLMRLPPVPGFDVERPPGWVAHGRRFTDASLFRQLVSIE